MLQDFRSGLRPPQTAIGVSVRLLPSDWSRALELGDDQGLLIERVYRGSPAAQAGLKGADRRMRVGNYLLDWGGDFVTHVDGKPVEREDEISRAASKKHAGESIELTIKRGSRSSKVRVVLAPLDDSSV